MKTCPRCSASVQDEVSFCPSCGNAFASASGVPSRPFPAATPTGYVGYPAYTGPQENSGKAIASLIFGLLFFIPFAFVAAIVLGHLGLSEIKKSAGRLKGQGIAIAGLVLGYGWVLLIPFMLIIAAIAIPNLLRARMAANEASAMGALRTYNTAIVSYATQCQNIGFPPAAQALGPGAGDCHGANLLEGILATQDAIRSGYRFYYSPGPAGNDGRIVSYTITADPVTEGTTGVRSYFTDESGVIRYSLRGEASADSPPVE